MTTAVTSKEDMVMTAATMCMSEAGVFIGLMVTGNECISRRRSSIYRLRRQASLSFFPPSLFIPKGRFGGLLRGGLF